MALVRPAPDPGPSVRPEEREDPAGPAGAAAAMSRLNAPFFCLANGG